MKSAVLNGSAQTSKQLCLKGKDIFCIPAAVGVGEVLELLGVGQLIIITNILINKMVF